MEQAIVTQPLAQINTSPNRAREMAVRALRALSSIVGTHATFWPALARGIYIQPVAGGPVAVDAKGKQATIPGLPPPDPGAPVFGKKFFSDHAGRIISKPETALVEIVANAWDAGATEVDIFVPQALGGELRFEDNGTGMTADEFDRRWRTLSYNRIENQGREVVFPPGKNHLQRNAFGQNGKGRHAMFAFADAYAVATAKEGVQSTWKVIREVGSELPFRIERIDEVSAESTGTQIWTKVEKNWLSEERVRDVIGARFVADPSFLIKVNGTLLTLTSIEDLVATEKLEIDGMSIIVRCVDGQASGRTMRHSGIAWWVNNRLVGQPSWKIMGTNVEDGRTQVGKRYTFIVDASPLAEHVEADWTAFKDDVEAVQKVLTAVRDRIIDILSTIEGGTRRDRKVAVLTKTKGELRRLGPSGQEAVGDFLDALQASSPTLSEKDLTNATRVLISLEQSRKGSELLARLSELDPDDLDRLNDILSEWTLRDAQLVLDELGRRLDLIVQLEKLVESPAADELHELQPLFEAGLWIFGPEYESIHYTSNRTLATVLKQLFEGKGHETSHPKRRPDFVVVPDQDCSFGVYSNDEFGADGESEGIGKVLIVELKRGGFALGRAEMRQAQDYVAELRGSGRIPDTAPIHAFVLGATLDSNVSEVTEGERDKATPWTYERILKRAHHRTFKLLDAMKDRAAITDSEIKEVLSQQSMDDFVQDSAVSDDS